MKIIIYISGIAGGLAFVFRLLGIFMEFPFNNMLVAAGIILLGLICLPLAIIDSYREKKKIQEIIQSHREKRIREAEQGVSSHDDSKKPRGWDMNTSPFRTRKSGLTWGGGNVKGARAKRGNKRSFLK